MFKVWLAYPCTPRQHPTPTFTPTPTCTRTRTHLIIFCQAARAPIMRFWSCNPCTLTLTSPPLGSASSSFTVDEALGQGGGVSSSSPLGLPNQSASRQCVVRSAPSVWMTQHSNVSNIHLITRVQWTMMRTWTLNSCGVQVHTPQQFCLLGMLARYAQLATQVYFVDGSI